MQLLCISTPNLNFFTGRPPQVKRMIVEGNPYTVRNYVQIYDMTFYSLEEMEPGDYWESNLFIPLSDIDETEIHSKTELQNA